MHRDVKPHNVMIDHEHRKVGRVCHSGCCVGPLPFLECAYMHLTNKLIILLQGTELTHGRLVPTLNHWNTYICSRPTQIQEMEMKLSMHITSVQNKPQTQNEVVDGDGLNTWCLYVAHKETPGWHFRIYPPWRPLKKLARRQKVHIKNLWQILLNLSPCGQFLRQ